MSSTDQKLSPPFLERQRERLEALRDQIRNDDVQAEAEDLEMTERDGNEVQDAGDEGANQARRITADAMSAKDELRLAEIQRALEKIAEGSYGLSDDSGEPIPAERLEAVPEARFTVEEEERRER